MKSTSPSKKSDAASSLATETQSLRNFIQWMVQKISEKKQTDEKLALDAKARDAAFIDSATDANLRLLNTELDLFLQQLISTTAFRTSTLGVTAEHFNQVMLARTSLRAQLILFLQDTIVEYLKQKNTTKLDLMQIFQGKRAQFEMLLSQIDALDKTARPLHAAQVRTIADDIKDLGFVPEANVTDLKLAPHKMSEKDMVQVLGVLVKQPIVTKETKDDFEVTFVQPPLDFSTGTHIFERQLQEAEKNLGKATKITMLYPVNDGRSHYEFLEVSVDRAHRFNLTLENSLPNPGTTDTATHVVFKNAKQAVEKIASGVKESKTKADLIFTGEQKHGDAVSCSFRTIQRIVNRSVPTRDDKLADYYKDIRDSKNDIDDLKLKVTQRLVSPAIASELKVDPVTHIVYRAEEKLDAKQKALLDGYKAAYVTREAEKAERTAEFKFRNYFGLPLKKDAEKKALNSGSKLVPLIATENLATVKIEKEALTQNVKALEAVTNQEIELGANLTKTPVDRPADYAKMATTIYHDKEQVDAYKKVLNTNIAKNELKKEAPIVANNLDGIETVRTIITKNIDLLLEKSNASVKEASKDFKDASIAKKAEAEANAAADAAKQAAANAAKQADDKALAESARKAEEARKVKTYVAHEQLTLYGEKFNVKDDADYLAAKAKQDDVKRLQEIEDEKLARILQNQDLLDRFFRPAKPVDQKQLDADAALARELQAEEDKKAQKKY